MDDVNNSKIKKKATY